MQTTRFSLSLILCTLLSITLTSCCLFKSGKRTVCRSEKGCPATTALPACVLAVQPLALSDLMKDPGSMKDQLVSVRAPLRMGMAACTMLACADDNKCCNGCGAGMFLAQDSPVDDKKQEVLRLHHQGAGGQSLVCTGDESLMCCPVQEMGQEVVATGKLSLMGKSALPMFARRLFFIN